MSGCSIVVKAKIVGLQVGRALAVVLVLLTHAIGHPYNSAPGVVHLLGREGVTLFFVISGYIMARLSGDGSFEPMRFLRKRFLRVVPLYYFVTLMMIVGVLVVPNAFKKTVFDLHHILFSLAFLPAFSPGPEPFVTPFMKLGWTLNYELFFYVCFAALCAFTAATRAFILLIVFGALAAYGLLVPQTTAAGLFYTDPGIMGFPAGVLLATFGGKDRQELSSKHILAFAAGSGALILIGLYYDMLRFAWPTQFVLILASTGLLYGLLAIRSDDRSPAISGLVTVGDASYSIYLFHMFAVGLTYNIGRHLVSPDQFWMLAPFAFVGGAVAGLLAYWLIENPLLQIFGYDRRRNTPAVTPVVP